MTDGTCSIADCDKPIRSLNLCSAHYGRLKRHGDPLAGRTPDGVPLTHYQKFLMVHTNVCKIWPFQLDSDGYPIIRIGEKKRKVHALSCEAWHGPKPSSIHQAAHGPCHDRSCWNGLHLSWRTPDEQQEDMVRDGTRRRGADKPNSKFTDEQIQEVRTLYALGTQRSVLASQFQVHYNTIDLIVRRKSYSHLK